MRGEGRVVGWWGVGWGRTGRTLAIETRLALTWSWKLICNNNNNTWAACVVKRKRVV